MTREKINWVDLWPQSLYRFTCFKNKTTIQVKIFRSTQLSGML